MPAAAPRPGSLAAPAASPAQQHPAPDQPGAAARGVQTVWETDAKGVNLYQSPSWYRYIGEGVGSSFGDDWLHYYHPDDRPHLQREWQLALASAGEHRYDVEARIRRHDGVYRWFRVQGVPVKAMDGQIVKWTGTCTELDVPVPAASSPRPRKQAPAPSRRPASRLLRRLAMLVLLGLLPLALLSLTTVAYNAKRQQEEFLASQSAAMRAIVLAVDSELATTQAALDALAASPRLAAGDLQGFRMEAASLLERRGSWANVVLTDRSGQQLMNLRVPEGMRQPGHPSFDLGDKVVRTRSAAVGDLAPSPSLGTQVFSVAVPVRRDHEVGQVLCASLWPSALHTIIARQTTPKGAVVGIFDAKRQVVVRTLNEPRWQGHSASAGLLSLMRGDRNEGWGVTATLDGTRVYSVFYRSPATGWSAAVGIPVEAIDAPVRHSVAVLLATTLVSVLGGLAAASFIARTVLRPMRKLEQAAAAVALGEAPTVPRADLPEIRRVGAALFSAHTEREKLLGTEREARRVEQEARLSAESANRAKDQFLAMLGHELRNPLAAIKGASQILERDDRPQVVAQANHIIQRQVRQLGRLADDLLDAGQVVVGNIALQCTPLDLAACVQATVDSLRHTGPLGGHDVAVSCKPVWVFADPARLEQIVANLLVNAGKYTPLPGRIRVSVGREGQDAVVRVGDNGVGLDAELQARVFDLFVQGGQASGRPQGGLGVGLTLARRLAELHGGSIHAHSDGPGCGSEFVVRLPAIER